MHDDDDRGPFVPDGSECERDSACRRQHDSAPDFAWILANDSRTSSATTGSVLGLSVAIAKLPSPAFMDLASKEGRLLSSDAAARTRQGPSVPEPGRKELGFFTVRIRVQCLGPAPSRFRQERNNPLRLSLARIVSNSFASNQTPWQSGHRSISTGPRLSVVNSCPHFGQRIQCSAFSRCFLASSAIFRSASIRSVRRPNSYARTCWSSIVVGFMGQL